jgi:serine/threonine-protein kinase
MVVAGLSLPSLVGQTIDSVQAWAAKNRISLQVTQVASTQPAATVLSQSPGAGTPVPAGQTVSLSVSGGPPAVRVPSVQGLTCPSAQEELQQAGFDVAVQQDLYRGTQATGTIPASQTQAAAGSTVTLTCGTDNPF